MPKLPLPDDPARLRDIIERTDKVLDHNQRGYTEYERTMTIRRLAQDAPPGPGQEQVFAIAQLVTESYFKGFRPAPSGAALLPFVDLPNPNEVPLTPLELSERLYEVAKSPDGPDVLRRIYSFTKDLYGKLLNDALSKLSAIEQNIERARRPNTAVDLADRKFDRQIIETLKTVGHRLTTTKLNAEMNKREWTSDSTLKKRLAELVKDGRLNNDPRARPRGYGLPEWISSSGSGGS